MNNWFLMHAFVVRESFQFVQINHVNPMKALLNRCHVPYIFMLNELPTETVVKVVSQEINMEKDH